MSDKYLLAIDAGTGSVRAVLFDLKGHQIDCVQEEWQHQEDPQWPGSMNFDWVHNWQLTCNCIKGVLSHAHLVPSDIIAISTTCMREGIVLYNQDGKEIWACANVDARSNDEVAQLILQDPELEKTLYSKSGQAFALGALPRLLWVKNKMPEIYEQTAIMGMFNDWLIYKLTGILALEPSNGSTTGVFDLQSRTWDPEIAQKCGLKTTIFPKVYECGTYAASVSQKGHEETGLAAGTPVIVGGGDAQLGCIGVGVVSPNEAAVFGGSFWQYEFNTASPQMDADCRLRVNCHAISNLWQYEALAFNPGLVMRWYRDGFCQEETALANKKYVSTYDIMNEKAASIPLGCYGMSCCFSDVMNFTSWKHAAPTFTNFDLNPERFNKYTFYRAILENTALVTLGHVQLVKQVTTLLPDEIIFAGGASKSPLWCQILSDVLGIPIKVPVVKEATALGAALLAGYGIGVYSDLKETTKQLITWDTTYLPNTANHTAYSALYETWHKIYQAQLALCDQKLTKNMWIAPGL